MYTEKKYKYPRTPHLPWSEGRSSDDIGLFSLSIFEGKQVIVTEKMDGECTTMGQSYVHARSVDSKHHPSRNWVKALQSQVGHQIPEGWRICGENLYAQHSIFYPSLPSYFMMFSIWDENNMCLSWEQTLEWAELLELEVPPVLFQGLWDEKAIQELSFSRETSEGYVVRSAGSFAYEDFGKNVAKMVRKGHVQTDKHWMHQSVVPNGLA